MASLGSKFPRRTIAYRMKGWGWCQFDIPQYVSRIDYDGPTFDGSGWTSYHGWQVKYPGYWGESRYFSDSRSSPYKARCTPWRSLQNAENYLAEVYAGVTCAERLRELGFA